ncbi:MAG TPA: ferredoxin [Firmicutes bacterium]|nr:ferredoxin [Bacillota bacterium]HAZ22390.1 ferredoxin [Bacillota bacterium]HBE05903.1 ferredoxin [Bacillota bacterium]HBL49439.1 ferredoxin [Bacillota bacterium]HBR23691.1 ferredoxin [Bacillota bacterium]
MSDATQGASEKEGRLEPRHGWRDMPLGGVIPKAGSATEYETGDWRSIRPLHSKERCINCLLCWVYCPDAAIRLQDGKVEGIDYEHCKGCGICAKECPQKVHAIEMVPEGRIKEMEAGDRDVR